MPLWIISLVLFIIGWAFAFVDNGWRSPLLWVMSAMAVHFILVGANL